MKLQSKWFMRACLQYGLLLLLACFRCDLAAQPDLRLIQKRIPNAGTQNLAPDMTVPLQDKGYSLWIPKKQKPVGMLVFFKAEWDSSGTQELHALAAQAQLAVAYISSGMILEFLFDDASKQLVESYIQECMTHVNLSGDKLAYLGISLEGTRALKMAKFAQESASRYHIKPRAAVLCDSPIDFVRFWQEGNRTKRAGFNDDAVNEATWVTGYLEKNLGGTPISHREHYENYSPYTYHWEDSKSALPYLGIAIRAYHEPNINWWIDQRRKDYYSMNSIDLAALVNDSLLMGNTEAQLMSTANRGRREDGSHHPHSWEIVDQAELISWFATMVSKNK